MKLIKNESGNIALIAVAVVVGMVVGFSVAKISHSDSHKDETVKTSSTGASKAAVDLRTNLVSAGLQHMTLTNQAVDAALDGSKTAEASGAALYANGTDIGAAVGSVYGPEAEKTFNTVWKLHLDEFVNYAVASSKGDAAAKKAALDKIDAEYTKPLSAYLAKANPNLPEATLNSVLGDHVQMTATMIDTHVAGNYADEFAQLKAANAHIVVIFSTLADAIAKQKNL